ncbi:uncharacterized protein VTP21DRAFT_8941 [Calcarisporiella thermophila]|uniref:uncharacterized protein n=1 Tax=Calcarisporiella thermophila TaxID=911321 RepID=UPI003744A380
MRLIIAFLLTLPFALAQPPPLNPPRNISNGKFSKLNQQQPNTTKPSISRTAFEEVDVKSGNATQTTGQEPAMVTKIDGPIIAQEKVSEMETKIRSSGSRSGRGISFGDKSFPEPNCKNLLNSDGSFNIPKFNINQDYGEKLRCYAILSYCANSPNPKIAEQLNNAGGFFQSYISANTKAFMAKAKDSIIISFAGTDDLKDIMDDVRAGHYVFADGVRISQGFYDYVNRVYGKMIQDLSNLVQRDKPSRVILTGHSLGGAAAQIAARRISFEPRINGVSLEVATFGQPAAGNLQFAQNIEKITNGKNNLPKNAPGNTPANHFEQMMALSLMTY